MGQQHDYGARRSGVTVSEHCCDLYGDNLLRLGFHEALRLSQNLTEARGIIRKGAPRRKECSKSIAIDLAEFGIRVNALAPGSIKTPATDYRKPEMTEEEFRRIRAEVRNGAAGDVVVHVAPTVAVQMDFWYDQECKELAKSIGRPIFVRVDPMIHPEKARIETVAATKREQERALRVGEGRLQLCGS